MKSMFCLVIGMALLASVSAFSAQKQLSGSSSANETGGACVGKADDTVYQKNLKLCASKTDICKQEANEGISRTQCPPAECNQVASKGDSGSQSTTK